MFSLWITSKHSANSFWRMRRLVLFSVGGLELYAKRGLEEERERKEERGRRNGRGKRRGR
jgi:hypothetical protein